MFVGCVILSSARAQPGAVQDMPPSVITPRFVPASKSATLPAIPVTPPPALPVTPPPALPVPPAIPVVVPALGTEAPVLPTPVALPPVPAQKMKSDVPYGGGFDATIESSANPELPGPQRLFRRDSEREFFERIAQDMKRTGSTTKAIFPEEPIISKEPFRARAFPNVVREVEPCYVCHRRLYFEQPNFERAGYDFGVLTPAMCVGAFYYDLALLPYHFWTDPQDRTECSAGKCLPGDQAPFLVHRERFSVTGLLGMTGAATGISLLFP